MSSLAILDVQPAVNAGGSLSVAFDYSAPWTDAAVAAIAEALSIFAEAGNIGGYRSVAKAPSGLEIIEGPVLRRSALAVALDAKNVDPRAFQYLRHLLGRPDFGPASVQRIVVRALHAAGELKLVRYPFVDDGNEEDAYPAPVNPKPFQVAWSEEASEKARRVEIELSRTVTDKDIDEIARLGRTWGSLLEGGAFSLPFGAPDEVDSFAGEAALFNQYAIEFDVPVYQASEAGWDVLLNMFATVAGRSLPIVNVTIE